MEVDIIHDIQGDWVALYVNGVLRAQGHHLPEDIFKSLLEELGAKTNDYQEADFSSNGSAPDYLNEVEITYG